MTNKEFNKIKYKCIDADINFQLPESPPYDDNCEDDIYIIIEVDNNAN
jgi:hypothetical protein